MTHPVPKYKINDLVIGMKTWAKKDLRKRKWIIRSISYNYFIKKFMYRIEELNTKEKNKFATVQENALVIELNGNEILKRLL